MATDGVAVRRRLKRTLLTNPHDPVSGREDERRMISPPLTTRWAPGPRSPILDSVVCGAL